MAGLAAASQLRDHDVIVYEKLPHYGGHTSSYSENGFTFDEGPHISFTKNERVRQIFADSVSGRYHEFPGIAFNYFQGHILRHPAQCHLYPLPAEIKKACLVDFVRAQQRSAGAVENYRDWCYRQFGKSFSEIFVRRYTRKYWTEELESLTTEWVGPRIVAPDLEEVIEGALTDSDENHNYISAFRYPLEGGFVAFARGLAQGNRILTGYEVEEIDTARRRLRFPNGKSESYDWLISTLPLPELVRCLKDASREVREAAERLRCTSHFLINVGVRGENPHDGYWIYFYDEEIPFSRVSYPSRFSPRNAPEGHYSLQAEIVHSPSRPLGDPARLVEQSIEWMIKVGLIRARSDVAFIRTQDIRYANVVFDLERGQSVRAIHDDLRKRGVWYCGRYGIWAYLWTDEAILSGEKAANEVRARMSGDLRMPAHS